MSYILLKPTGERPSSEGAYLRQSQADGILSIDIFPHGQQSYFNRQKYHHLWWYLIHSEYVYVGGADVSGELFAAASSSSPISDVGWCLPFTLFVDIQIYSIIIWNLKIFDLFQRISKGFLFVVIPFLVMEPGSQHWSRLEPQTLQNTVLAQNFTNSNHVIKAQSLVDSFN